MTTKLVLIRHLEGHVPVAMAIIEPSDDPDVDDQESYMKSKAEDIRIEFQKKFVEFKQAKFYTNLLDVND